MEVIVISSFRYSGKIDRLKEFYRAMHSLHVHIGTFEHRYNSIISDVVFDTREWKLIFIKKRVGETLSIRVKRGFRFTIDGNGEYRKFISYFNIGGGKGQFKIKDFIEHFSAQVPTGYTITDNIRQTIMNYDCLDSKSEGIYPIGIKNWEVIHAKNPDLPKEKYHRTEGNLQKTKELYPKIFNEIKDKDITIIYGKEPGDSTDRIKKCNF